MMMMKSYRSGERVGVSRGGVSKNILCNPNLIVINTRKYNWMNPQSTNSAITRKIAIATNPNPKRSRNSKETIRNHEWCQKTLEKYKKNQKKHDLLNLQELTLISSINHVFFVFFCVFSMFFDFVHGFSWSLWVSSVFLTLHCASLISYSVLYPTVFFSMCCESGSRVDIKV